MKNNKGFRDPRIKALAQELGQTQTLFQATEALSELSAQARLFSLIRLEKECGNLIKHIEGHFASDICKVQIMLDRLRVQFPRVFERADLQRSMELDDICERFDVTEEANRIEDAERGTGAQRLSIARLLCLLAWKIPFKDFRDVPWHKGNQEELWKLISTANRLCVGKKIERQQRPEDEFENVIARYTFSDLSQLSIYDVFQRNHFFGVGATDFDGTHQYFCPDRYSTFELLEALMRRVA